MSAYMFVKCEIYDREAFAAYGKRAAELVAQFGGTYLVVGGESEILEGETSSASYVISKWPTMDAARKFWNSPEYAEAKKLREGNSKAHVTIVQGLGDG